jgi:hypothetical protein
MKNHPTKPLTAFISGHITVENEEFARHYADKILEAYSLGHHFVIGDADGIDLLAQKLLLVLGANPERVTIYHMFDKPRFNLGFKTSGGYKNDEERDAAMTKNSNYDIAWVRPGKEKSGTARNLERRKKFCER